MNLASYFDWGEKFNVENEEISFVNILKTMVYGCIFLVEALFCFLAFVFIPGVVMGGSIALLIKLMLWCRGGVQ